MNTCLDDVCGLRLHRVLEPDRTAFLRTLSSLSKSKDPFKFPGSNPCSLERADFPKLRQQPYFVCEKTNGVRFLVVFCSHAGLDVCCIVDRAMKVYVLPVRASPTAMFQGSILDCELAYNKMDKQWQLLAFDAYVVSGVPVFHQPFSVRIKAAQRAMTAYAFHVDDPAPIVCKQFWPSSMFRAFRTLDLSTRSFFDVDGIILTPELSPAVIGRHHDLFKVKTHHTIDFLVGDDGVDLRVYDPAARSHASVARLRRPARPGSIVECARAADMAWDVVCVRTDKAMANDVLTFQKTLVNAQEGITYDELQSFFESI